MLLGGEGSRLKHLKIYRPGVYTTLSVPRLTKGGTTPMTLQVSASLVVDSILSYDVVSRRRKKPLLTASWSRILCRVPAGHTSELHDRDV